MLEELRNKALFQNSVDVWITLCKEQGKEWDDVDNYMRFIDYLRQNNVKINRFNLCVKESTTDVERSRKKVEFLDKLAKIGKESSMVYTIKLDAKNLEIIRRFK